MDELTYHACPFLAYAVKLDLGQERAGYFAFNKQRRKKICSLSINIHSM